MVSRRSYQNALEKFWAISREVEELSAKLLKDQVKAEAIEDDGFVTVYETSLGWINNEK